MSCPDPTASLPPRRKRHQDMGGDSTVLTQTRPNPDHFLQKKDPHIRRSEAFPLGLRTWVAVQALHTQPLSAFSILTHSLGTWIRSRLEILVPRVAETRQGSEGKGVPQKKGWVPGCPDLSWWGWHLPPAWSRACTLGSRGARSSAGTPAFESLPTQGRQKEEVHRCS